MTVVISDALIGQRVFGGYVVTRKIGQGGMGTVYLAENPLLGTKLALKLLLPEFSQNEQIVKRFVAEARAASSIDNPHIISIIDSARLDDGRYYILMEYLEGNTVEGYAQSMGPLPIDTALTIIVQVCSGLEAAHERGIFHRDLKPANLFVTPRPTSPLFTKILDFGIAKLKDERLAGGIKTGTNIVMGTPAYMSPEQARAAEVDHRTDIYSLGVIAYQLLTRKLPYSAATIGGLAYQQATKKPDHPCLCRPDLPQGWVDAIASAMAIEAKGRPQNVRAFAQSLILATPDGDALARAAAPLLYIAASPDEETTKNREQGAAHVRRTTLTAAAGVASPDVASAPRRHRWLVAAILVAVLAAGGAALGLLGRGSGEKTEPARTTETASLPPVDGGPIMRDGGVRIESETLGATIYVDGDRQEGLRPLEVEPKDAGLQADVKPREPKRPRVKKKRRPKKDASVDPSPIDKPPIEPDFDPEGAAGRE